MVILHHSYYDTFDWQGAIRRSADQMVAGLRLGLAGWMDFKKNWGSMAAKGPLFGHIDIFQTSPSCNLVR
jgi:hypothetical protein